MALNGGLVRRKVPQILTKLIANATEHGKPFVVGALSQGWVIKTVMDADALAGKDRATFVSTVTNGEDVIEMLPIELVHAFGTVGGNVDADLSHCVNRFGSNPARRGSGAEHFKAASGVVTQQPFGHLAPG